VAIAFNTQIEAEAFKTRSRDNPDREKLQTQHQAMWKNHQTSQWHSRNAEAIQEVLNDWQFKDLWTRESNEQQETERKILEHLTHWNHKHTRKECIDRIYANFRIEANVTVSTHHHHRGVL
jgi:hypothetical protein